MQPECKSDMTDVMWVNTRIVLLKALNCRIYIQMRSDFASESSYCGRLLYVCDVECLLLGTVLERIVALHKEVGNI
jgi:hypothetical protein